MKVLRSLGYVAAAPFAVIWFLTMVARAVVLLIPYWIAQGRDDREAEDMLFLWMVWPLR